jgi:alpha-mannosidase
VSVLFRTSNMDDAKKDKQVDKRVNILEEKHIVGWSGYTRNNERPALMIDGNESTKWCDVTILPNYVDFDLGKEENIKGWEVLNAAQESQNYVTSSCYLLGKNSKDEEWKTIDFVTGNKQNVINREFGELTTARYLRLMVTQPVQNANSRDTRIYEFSVYR